MSDVMPPFFPMRPIGLCRTPFLEKAQAPRQPADAPGTIELFPGRGYEDALADLESWSHLWVIFVFDRDPGFRPKVQPPRSSAKRGVLATRSPHRPNPIGMSLVTLERLEGLTLHVRGVDMLDGSPVLDVKPYVAYADAAPSANGGWLAREAARDPLPEFAVEFSERAREQLEFLGPSGQALRQAAERALRLGPRPHAYRRIRCEGEEHCLAVKSWRVVFAQVGERAIRVERIRSGERPRTIAVDTRPALDEHRAFVARFGLRG